MNRLVEIIDELLVSGHQAVIHFPIIGIFMGAFAGFTALVIAIFIHEDRKIHEKTWVSVPWLEKLVDRFEFSSWILIWMGEVFLILAAWTGFRSAGTTENAVSNELLAFKVKLTIYTFFILMTPLFLKFYLSVVEKKPVFGHSRIIPLFYVLPMIVGAFLTVLISGAGGRYTYGHSILDTVGFGWLLPG